MDFLETILSNIVILQVITALIKASVGLGLCFAALKWRQGALVWRRGLLTTISIAWGFALGVLAASTLDDSTGALLYIIIGVIALPILTYTVPGVNRFMLGFLVASKLFFMLTTVLAKSGDMEVETAVFLPLIAGTVVGVCLMAWTKVRVSAFVLACTFIGAAETAPAISELINRIFFTFTSDISYLFDPIDFLFGLFGIELTDKWTLVAMIILMIWGGYKQVNNIKAHGIPLNTPLIGFETRFEDNGKIITDYGTVDTMK